ncbi:hypothetical protein NDU88_001298, partial [Pleurodeles waltl]
FLVTEDGSPAVVLSGRPEKEERKAGLGRRSPPPIPSKEVRQCDTGVHSSLRMEIDGCLLVHQDYWGSAVNHACFIKLVNKTTKIRPSLEDKAAGADRVHCCR